MKKQLVRFLVWLLRKVRGEDPAPTVELGSLILCDGVEYVCACTELAPAHRPEEPRLQMSFVEADILRRTRTIIIPAQTEQLDFTIEFDPAVLLQELGQEWGISPETLVNGQQRNDALDCQRYAQTALEMQGVASVSVLQPAPACADYSKCHNCLCNDCNPCHRGPVHPCEGCGDRPTPHLTLDQRCPSREMWG